MQPVYLNYNKIPILSTEFKNHYSSRVFTQCKQAPRYSRLFSARTK